MTGATGGTILGERAACVLAAVRHAWLVECVPASSRGVVEVTGLSLGAVRAELAALRAAGLVNRRRCGWGHSATVFYRPVAAE